MKKFNAVKSAERILNTHHYAICEHCGKGCKAYCLPAEMFVQLLNESDDIKLQQLENVKGLFTDD